ncbi:hypothetical protein ASF88_07275 [Leifsonia sp. Leaf336]|uniref:hypothetical protein n=1 Tax=Leifsonia sp. Leaf336 TaxID=1736341 RepID=UPI0006F24A30|nr:hypothetical protein [Leifsonia sp. Leaf336]KQR54566.1 hypothetical protein ASF88_07275 [Leifsonia sp. Leaf336]
MGELEPRKRSKKAVVPRRIPSEVVPIPLDEAPGFVREALRGTSLMDPFAQLASGWVLFEPHLRFVPVDETHTRIEFDAVGRARGVDTMLYTRRLGEIDRFFVALQDELDRRERTRRPGNASSGEITGSGD